VTDVTLPFRVSGDSAETSSMGNATRMASQGPPADETAEAKMREIYREHGRSVYYFLLSLTLGNHQAAEDLTQETLLRAWRHLDILNADVRTLRPWLFTVARRLAIDALRARASRPVTTNVDVDHVPHSDDTIERMLNATTVRRALPRLRPEFQQVIIEMYYHGRTAKETAKLLGIPEGTAKSRAYYALRALRAVIGAVEDDGS
jgi:RNA polymerase sigma-70 factor, ECF subfamily